MEWTRLKINPLVSQLGGGIGSVGNILQVVDTWRWRIAELRSIFLPPAELLPSLHKAQRRRKKITHEQPMYMMAVDRSSCAGVSASDTINIRGRPRILSNLDTSAWRADVGGSIDCHSNRGEAAKTIHATASSNKRGSSSQVVAVVLCWLGGTKMSQDGEEEKPKINKIK